jgi:glyoxylase-like metal-dependent hydrolase (beta-lactamase superfamily II)
VVNSHLHAGHSGWNTVRRGDAVVPYFDRAAYHIHRHEIEDARHANERTMATYLAENFEPVAAVGRLEPVEGETYLTDEVTLIETPGHTRGHIGVAISSGGETALYLGDMLQHEVQLGRLPWIAAFDVMPMVSLETKRSIVERAVRDHSLLLCGHVTFPGAGFMVAPEGGRPRFEPAVPETA